MQVSGKTNVNCLMFRRFRYVLHSAYLSAHEEAPECEVRQQQRGQARLVWMRGADGAQPVERAREQFTHLSSPSVWPVRRRRQPAVVRRDTAASSKSLHCWRASAPSFRNGKSTSIGIEFGTARRARTRIAMQQEIVPSMKQERIFIAVDLIEGFVYVRIEFACGILIFRIDAAMSFCDKPMSCTDE